MNENPLLNKGKYNPDVMMKYSQMKNQRNNVAVNQEPLKFDKIDNLPELKKSDILKNRQIQDSNFSQIFSKENYIRNKLFFENRQQEVIKICNSMNFGESYDMLKR